MTDPSPPIDGIEALPGAFIGMTPCPGTDRFPSGGPAWQRDVGADFDVIARWGAAAVVTLLQASELSRPSLDELRWHAERRGIEWYHLPVRDQAIPTSAFETAWPPVAARLHALLGERRKVLLHCMAGFGRSGMIAARLLVELGEEPRAAIQRVRAVRRGAIETAAQEAYVLACRRRAEP